MKKVFLSASVIALAASSALADDLPSRIGRTALPPLWTGFYAGLNAGYGWGTNNSTQTVAAPLIDNFANSSWTNPSSGVTFLANSGTANVNQSGFIGGGQIGYNWQFAPSFVLGIEADIQGAGIRGSGGFAGASANVFSSSVANFAKSTLTANSAEAIAISWLNPTLSRSSLGTGQITANVDWLGTVRGRLGYLVKPNLMIYATGGLAYGGVSASGNFFDNTTNSFTAEGYALAYAQATGLSPTASATATISATGASATGNATAGANPTPPYIITAAGVVVNSGTFLSAVASRNESSAATNAFLNVTTSVAPPSASAVSSGTVQTQSSTSVADAQFGPSSVTTNAPMFSTTNRRNTNVGWSVGGGVEWMFLPNWSLKAEGLYYYLGSMTTSTQMISAAPNPFVPALSFPPANIARAITNFAGSNLVVSNINTTRVKFDGVIARVGINYHFSWGNAPLVSMQ